MNYETCKRLEDSGFPQKTILDGERRNGWVNAENKYADWEVDNDFIYAPLLEELIEECGEEEWFDLHFYRAGKGFKWVATQSNPKFQQTLHSDDECFIGKGPNPLIAVANLYLALHEKK